LHHGGTEIVAGSQRRALASALGRISQRTTERGSVPARRDRWRGLQPAGGRHRRGDLAEGRSGRGPALGHRQRARPTPAVTAGPPIPGELKPPAPEPQPLLSADPNAWNPLPKALVADPIGFISELAEPSIEMPEVSIDPDEAAPEARLVPDVTAVDDEARVVKDDTGNVDDEDNVAGIAAEDSAELSGVDSAEVSGVDSAEVSGVDSAEVSADTVCTPVPAEVPTACVTAAASPDTPAGVVVSSGVVKAVSVDAAEEAPA
jgi:hypothetical protein